LHDAEALKAIIAAHAVNSRAKTWETRQGLSK
jgi:hypothetical protein